VGTVKGSSGGEDAGDAGDAAADGRAAAADGRAAAADGRAVVAGVAVAARATGSTDMMSVAANATQISVLARTDLAFDAMTRMFKASL
jgi:hypothetical protein